MVSLTDAALVVLHDLGVSLVDLVLWMKKEVVEYDKHYHILKSFCKNNEFWGIFHYYTQLLSLCISTMEGTESQKGNTILSEVVLEEGGSMV